MPPFLYRCPNTGYRVQGFVAEEISDDQTYLSITCIMCRQIHLVNPSTGRVVGEDDNTSASTAPAALAMFAAMRRASSRGEVAKPGEIVAPDRWNKGSVQSGAEGE